MKAQEFLDFFTEQIKIDRNSFVKNMEKLHVERDLHEWVEILINWMKLGNEDDAQSYYGDYYKEPPE